MSFSCTKPVGLLALALTAKSARKQHQFERLTLKQFSFVEYVYVIHETSKNNGQKLT